MAKDNEGKWNENDVKHTNRINTLEKCSVSSIGAIIKHSIKKKKKTWRLGLTRKSIINVKGWF